MGIEAVRKCIVNATNKRSLFILKTDNNERLITAFQKYHWKLDAQGNITDKPDHDEHSDVMDGCRYLYQNVYGKKNKINFSMATGDKKNVSNNHADQMTAKISELATNDAKTPRTTTKKRILFS